MEELIDRIGAVTFFQIAIESWNEIFLLILIAVMMIGINRDKADELVKQVKIPLTYELVLFFAAIFVYNLSDIFSVCFDGMQGAAAYYCKRVSVFGYYAAGAFQTLLLLQVIRSYIAQASESPKLHKAVFAFQLLQSVNALLLLVTPFTNALYYIDADNDYNRSWGYWIWQAITILSFLFIVAAVIARWKQISSFLKKSIIAAAVFPLIGLVTSTLIPGISFNNIMVAITSLILFVIYEKNKATIITTKIHELETARAEIAESRLTMMLAQIKPHFIYNSMNAIMELCYTEPELAAETIAHFSDFLRGKLDAFDSKELSCFDDELAMIKEYLSIEYADRNKVFRMEYDLAVTDFRLPALTVQPLVENAVKHGIDRYSGDSLVQLITYEDAQNIYIKVTDNGTAEQGDETLFAKERGVGLSNAAERLNMLCGGNIAVTHDETGTTAVVTIPKLEQEEV